MRLCRYDRGVFIYQEIGGNGNVQEVEGGRRGCF